MPGGLMLAKANAKCMQSPSPCLLPLLFVWNQKVGHSNKDSKSSGSGGGWLLLTAPAFSLSLPLSPSLHSCHCVSLLLCLFLWLSLTMSGLSGMVQHQPPLMECYYVVPVSIWPGADCTYFPWSCVHLSLTHTAFYCACVSVCVSVCM